jgi:hypothetical protein
MPFYLPLVSLNVKFIDGFIGINRELVALGRLLTLLSQQSTEEMIETGTQLIENVAGENAEPTRDQTLRVELFERLRTLRVVVGSVR